MQLPRNQFSSSSSQRWLCSNELKTDHQSKIASAIRSIFVFQVTYTYTHCTCTSVDANLFSCMMLWLEYHLYSAPPTYYMHGIIYGRHY